MKLLTFCLADFKVSVTCFDEGIVLNKFDNDFDDKSDDADDKSTDDDYVSLVRIPRKWFYVFVWTFCVLTIGHTIFDVFFGLGWVALGETPLLRMSILMGLIVGWFFMLSQILEFIMLGYAKLYKERIHAAGMAAGMAQGKAEGMAQGKAEGMAQGKKELFEELREAQRRGIPLEEVLENYEAENGNADDPDTQRTDSRISSD